MILPLGKTLLRVFAEDLVCKYLAIQNLLSTFAPKVEGSIYPSLKTDSKDSQSNRATDKMTQTMTMSMWRMMMIDMMMSVHVPHCLSRSVTSSRM